MVAPELQHRPRLCEQAHAPLRSVDRHGRAGHLCIARFLSGAALCRFPSVQPKRGAGTRASEGFGTDPHSQTEIDTPLDSARELERSKTPARHPGCENDSSPFETATFSFGPAADFVRLPDMLQSPPAEADLAPPRADAWFGPGRFAILLGLLLVAAFPDVVFGARTFFYRDFGIFGYPLAHYHRESFWNGEVPLWNPLNACGLPFLAQWNTMVLYPGALFYLIFPLSWSLGVFCLLHLFGAGLGMHFLAREWTGHRLAACVAGLAFAFNGLTLSCLKWPNNIAALAWMPWVVWLAGRGWRHGGRHLVLAALAGAMQMLAGGPEIILFTWLLTLAFWAAEWIRKSAEQRAAAPPNFPAPDQAHHAALSTNLRWGETPSNPDFSAGQNSRARQSLAPPRDGFRSSLREFFFWNVLTSVEPGRGRIAARFVLLCLLVAGLTAAQMLPFLDLLQDSQRDAAFADASWSMPLWGWANFLVPLFRCFPSYHGVFAQFGQYWVSSYYAGIGTLVLAGCALGQFRNSRVRGLGILALTSLVLALGPDGYLYAALKSIVPAIQVVRFPIKFVTVTAFVLPLLAAFAVADPRRRHRPLLILGSVFFGLIGVVLWIARTYPLATDLWSATAASALSRTGFLGLTLCLIALLRHPAARTWTTALGYGLLLVTWLDLVSQAPRLNPTVERWVYHPGLAKAELKLNPEPGLGTTRALVSPWADLRLNHLALTNAAEDHLSSRLSLFANCNLLEALPKIDGFFSLYLREESRVRSLLYASTNTSLPGLARFLGVSQATAPGKTIEWSVQSDPLPLATAGQKPEFADGPATLRALADSSFNPSKIVYLPLEARGTTTATNAVKADVSVRRIRTHELELAVQAEAPTWVVLAQAHYHPWRAYLGGNPVRIWPANHAFQAIAVPAGRHTVRLVYEDRVFQAGAVLSFSSVIFCLALWCWPRNRERLVPPASHES